MKPSTPAQPPLQGISWNLYPRINVTACDFTNGTSGPTLLGGLLGDGGAAAVSEVAWRWRGGGVALAGTWRHLRGGRAGAWCKCRCGLTMHLRMPTLESPLSPSPSQPLPDIRGWTYAGTAQVGNAQALVWQVSGRQWGQWGRGEWACGSGRSRGAAGAVCERCLRGAECGAHRPRHSTPLLLPTRNSCRSGTATRPPPTPSTPRPTAGR